MNVGEIYHEDEDEHDSDEDEYEKIGKRSQVKVSDIKIDNEDESPPNDINKG